MERDEKVFVLGEDVGKKVACLKRHTVCICQFGEDRALDAPLAESAIAGVAIGAAMYGMRPIAEMQFADFIMPAVNQIVSEAAKFVIVLIMIGLVSYNPCTIWRGCSRCIVSFTICRSDVCKPTRF